MHPLLLLPALVAAPQPQGATPEAFLAQAPAVPKAPWTVGARERDSFREQVRKVLAGMDERIEQRKRAQEKAAKASGQALGAKLTGGAQPPTKEEKQRLKSMTKEEKMAFAMARMNGMGGMDPAAMKELQARNQATQEAVKLTQGGSPRIDRIAQVVAKYGVLEQEFRAAAGAGRDYSAAPRTLSPELARTYTARFQKLLGEHQEALKAALPDFKKMAELEAKGSGVAPGEAVSLDALRAVRDYTERLQQVFDYAPLN